jgi:hypothetical protein
MVPIGAPRSTTIKEILNPPCLSTFKRRGGPELGMQLSDGQDQCAWINDAWKIPSFSAALYLVIVGPFLRYVTSLGNLSPVAMCHRSASPLWPLWSLPHLIIHSPPKSSHLLSGVLLPSPIVFRQVSSSVALLTPRHFFHVLTVSTPPLLSCTPSFALASTPIRQAIQLFQVAAQGVFHISKC